VTPTLRTAVIDLLSTHIPERWVRERARSLGVARRVGKIDPYALVMVVLLGLVVRGPTAIAQLRQVYCRVGGISLARSAFWSRMSPSLATLMWEILARVMNDARSEPVRPPGVLSGFRDVIAVDASVIKVHDKLRPVWKGTRRNSAKAALKLHAWVRVFTGELVKARITADAYADSKAFGIDQNLRGVLVLFDRGYASPSLWRRIDSVGGYFLCRVPKGWNQRIETNNRRCRGRASSLIGLGIRDAFLGLHRPILDVMASFECRIRGYSGGKMRKVKQAFRVVAIRHPETGEYALYATNAPVDKLPARHIREVYRLRWEVETFFKLGKSGCGMNELPSSKEPIGRLFLTAGLLGATLCMRAKAAMVQRFAPGQAHRVAPLQWVKWWNDALRDVLRLVLFGLRVWRPRAPADELALLFDPNHRCRPPTRTVFATP
jgi:putative transposase